MTTETRRPGTGHVAADDLSAYVDGELAHEERLAVEAHLASCRACRDELATLSWTVDFTRAMPRTQVPPGVSFHVPVGEPSALDEASGRSGLSILAWGSMAVAAAAVVLAVLQARPFAMTGANPSAAGVAMEDSSSQAVSAATPPADAPVPPMEARADLAVPEGADAESAEAESAPPTGALAQSGLPAAAAVASAAVATAPLDEIGGAGDLAADQLVTPGQSAARIEAEAIATASAAARPTERPTAAVARAPSGPRAAARAPQPDSGQSVRWIALAVGATALAAAAFALGRRSRR